MDSRASDDKQSTGWHLSSYLCVYKYRDTNAMNKPFTLFSLTLVLAILARHTNT